MIRGVDREIRKAVKDAAKAEGVSVGTWVRRSLVRALAVAAKGPAAAADLSELVRVLEARLSVLETSHRALNQKVHDQKSYAAGALSADAAGEKRTRWRRTKRPSRTKKSK
jgi:hypothetical protein